MLAALTPNMTPHIMEVRDVEVGQIDKKDT